MIDLSVSSGVAWLTLRRPEKLNALDRVVISQLAEHLHDLRERSDVRVVVTKGEGRAYCAGSDLGDIADLSPAEAASAERQHGAVCALLDTLPQPTIAMVHGYVLGGGVGLALYHDFRIAAAATTFGMPEVELGWTPPWAIGRLMDVIGSTHARWLALSCSRLSADEAKTIGLVNAVVPDEALESEVTQLAARLAAMPPKGLAETKALINQMSPLRSPHWDAAASAAFEACYGTAEAQANVQAFLARRGRS
jgi:enoyl-CoA hydratase/carnithine racemase